jgi:FkbM family methyltransferase
MNLKSKAKALVKRLTLPDTQRRICHYRGSHFFADAKNKIEARLIAGDYDRDLLTLLSMIVKPAHVCMDVGANIGVYSVMMSALAGHAGAVHSFEPVNHIRRRALLNLQLNGARNVRMNDFALGDTSGSTKMLQVKDGIFRGGTSSMLETEAIVAMGRDKFDEIDVKVDTLDAYVAHAGLKKLDFIKMDVEGFELSVLRGASDTLARFRPSILFEHDLKRLRKIGASENDFAKIFKENDYVVMAPRDLVGTFLVDEYCFDGKGAKRNMLAFPI